MSDGTDREYFAAQVPLHITTMVRVAAALVGVADAEATVQEALIRAWQGWPSLRDRAALRGWLLRITVNVCHNWQQGRFGTRRRLMESLEASGAADPIATLDTDPGASEHMAALDVYQAINRLDTDYRVVVVLRFFAGMDATEVGAALGLPSGTVRTRLRRALTLLHAQLSASGDLPPSHTRKRDAHV